GQATARIQQALHSLSSSDAALLVLTAVEGYSPSQAAEVLGISDGAARTRLYRARARLAKSLEFLASSEIDVITQEGNQ
ncbi:MAG: sigma factor-like helix-turn-helix DNA-binding protein, partial [Acidimicrobiales bacterium]